MIFKILICINTNEIFNKKWRIHEFIKSYNEMIQIFRKLGPRGLISIFRPDGDGNLLNWGENFYTRVNRRNSLSENNGYFIVQFKKAIVHIKSYKIKAMPEAPFPKKWDLYVSNDNLTWEPISHNTTPLCKDEHAYTVPNDQKDYCNTDDIGTYSTNHTGFHYFVKFFMTENSYYVENNGWQDGIWITGFELIGSFARDHFVLCSSRKNRFILSELFLTTLTFGK